MDQETEATSADLNDKKDGTRIERKRRHRLIQATTTMLDVSDSINFLCRQSIFSFMVKIISCLLQP